MASGAGKKSSPAAQCFTAVYLYCWGSESFKFSCFWGVLNFFNLEQSHQFTWKIWPCRASKLFLHLSFTFSIISRPRQLVPYTDVTIPFSFRWKTLAQGRRHIQYILSIPWHKIKGGNLQDTLEPQRLVDCRWLPKTTVTVLTHQQQALLFHLQLSGLNTDVLLRG